MNSNHKTPKEGRMSDDREIVIPLTYDKAKWDASIAKMFDIPASALVGLTTTQPMVTYEMLRKAAGSLRLVPPTEPAKLSDCPHKPGTPEHRTWVRKNVLEPQADSRTEASKAERARITGLTQDRRVQMDTDQARRAAELDAMIADLPKPNVPIQRDLRYDIEQLADRLGVTLLPWQQHVLDDALSTPGPIAYGNYSRITIGDVDMTQYVRTIHVTQP